MEGMDGMEGKRGKNGKSWKFVAMTTFFNLTKLVAHKAG
jgi:hypothetical protein